MTRRRSVYAMTGVALIVLLVAGIAAYYMMMPSGQAQGSPDPQDSSVIASNFRVLSQAHTDVCAYLGNQQANANYINSLADDFYLQGSCCFPMDYNHYVSQTNGLKNHSDIPIISQNPYNVSASHAKETMSYATLTMTSAQQAVYDNAAKASSEGPCCCKCWAWYAHEGLAKALISQDGWSAQQILNIWSLEDCCGGA